uniref:Agouti domain-containing protein n=1 Tax=Acanthochromis polyacanthus TaxID=80966 RepID=A0A3Q1FA27_9TELE
MKLELLCLCLLHLAFLSCGLFAHSELQSAGGSLSVNRSQVTPSPGVSDQVGSLFARRRQYGRQMIYVQKPRVVPVAPGVPSTPAKVASKPMKPKCSQLNHTCSPQAGCCDPCATCHCRFFNAICFCRRKSSQHEKKT